MTRMKVRDFIEEMGSQAVIPSNGAGIKPIEHDRHIYKERCLVENFFQFIKRFRCIGTRYEMRAQKYAGMVTMACIIQ